MKKPLAFKLMVNPKDVRRAVALITGEAFTDEELNDTFFGEAVEVECPEGQELETTAAFVALIMAQNLEESEGKPKGKFAQKLDELLNDQK